MKILHLYSGNLMGGIETFLLTLNRLESQMPSLSMEYALFFEGKFSESLRRQGATVHQLGAVQMRNPVEVVRRRRALLKLLETRQVDAVVCHAAWVFSLFGSVARKRGTPVIYWVHDIIGNKHPIDLLSRLTRPDFLIANSGCVEQKAKRLFPNVKSQVIYCPSKKAPIGLIKPVTKPKKQVILQACRISRQKGIHTLLEALGSLRLDERWECWVLGTPQRPTDFLYQQHLDHLVQLWGLKSRVKFVRGVTDIRPYLLAGDIFVQVNDFPEPYGLSIIEAMSAKLPVIVADEGGPSEFVDATNGVKIRPREPHTLAGAIKRLLEDPGHRKRLGQRASLKAAELGNPQVFCSHLSALFESIASSFPANMTQPVSQKCRKVG